MTLKRSIACGFCAGLLGGVVLASARVFDREYAPRTVGVAIQSNGKPTKYQTIGTQLACSVLAGILYGVCRDRDSQTTSLRDGATLGGLTYGMLGLGLLPATGLIEPIWKQNFPQIAGGGLRHFMQGITIAAVFGYLNAKL